MKKYVLTETKKEKECLKHFPKDVEETVLVIVLRSTELLNDKIML